MIFVSLGTMDMPFYRMAKAVDEWAATTEERVVVQTGYTNYEYKNIKNIFRFCTKDEMQKYIDEADILILQGGWGAISEAMEKKADIINMSLGFTSEGYKNLRAFHDICIEAYKRGIILVAAYKNGEIKFTGKVWINILHKKPVG